LIFMKSFSVQFRVSWVETDAANVVHFSNYFRYFERAEEEFYNSLGIDFQSFSSSGIWFPRIEAYCRYLSPCKFNDLIEVTLQIDEIREKAIRYRFIVNNLTSGKKAAEGYFVIVSANIKENQAIPLPREIVEKLKAFCSKNTKSNHMSFTTQG